MDLKRIMRHLSSGHASVRRAFPPPALDAIERAIRETEARHDGQIRLAAEAALDLAPLLAGIRAVGEHLAHHFPAQGGKLNEMPDSPVVL